MESGLAMSKDLNPRASEYFARDDAAAQWWTINHRTQGRYGRQLRMLRRRVTVAGKVALDIATGRGRFAIEFAKLGAKEVTAIDISAAMIENARADATAAGVVDRIRFRVGDANDDLVPDGSVDVCSLMEVLVHLPQPARIIATVARYLRSGGFFVTNWDLPFAPLVTFPIDKIHWLAGGIRRGRFGSSTVRYPTLDATIDALKSGAKRVVDRPKDVYRGLPRSEVESLLRANGLTIVKRMWEYTSLLRMPVPIPIGEMVIARKA